MTSSMSRMALSRPPTRCSGAAAYDVDAVAEEGVEHRLEAERARRAVDQGDRVDAEGVLERRLAVELLEDRVGDEAVLDLGDQAQALVAVAQLLDVRDALQL